MPAAFVGCLTTALYLLLYLAAIATTNSCSVASNSLNERWVASKQAGKQARHTAWSVIRMPNAVQGQVSSP